MPSIQGIALVLAGLNLLLYAMSKKQTLSVYLWLGGVTGISLLFHSISGLILYGSSLLTIFIYNLINIKKTEFDHKKNWLFL